MMNVNQGMPPQYRMNSPAPQGQMTPQQQLNMPVMGGYQLPQAQGGTDPNTPPWLTGISDLFNLGGSAYGLAKSFGLGDAANTVFNQSNPFGKYRPGYGADLLS